MISIKVNNSDIDFAKKQIKEFEKTKKGKWRYKNVEAWRGVVCEMLTGKWFEENYNIEKKVKGLDTSGIVDDCDLIINKKKIEIKSATKNYFKFIMPKVNNVINNPKDFYVGVKYNETINPNEVLIIGYIRHNEVLKYPIKKNKGAAYYEVPLNKLTKINKNEI